MNHRTLVFDLHCDTPLNIYKHKFVHIKPDILHKQGYLGAVFAHFIKPNAKYPFLDAIKLISSTITYINRKKNLSIIYSHGMLDSKKVNIVLGVEGGHIFDSSFKQIEMLYDLGVRVLTITWNNSNRLAHSAQEADKKGLTRKGKEYIKELANYDIIIDLSHASTRTVLDVCDLCINQVIASHSCVRMLNKKFLRNIDDRAIKAIAKRNGVVGINFSRYHLGGHNIIDHISYLKDKFGLQIIGIGSDFDGINDAVISGPRKVRGLEEKLLSKGYKRKELDEIFYKNFLKIFRKSSIRTA